MSDLKTSPRYFYTDPLAAAWMTKHFGMKIHAPVLKCGPEGYGESDKPLPVWVWARKIEQVETGRVNGVERYYIHPDSLPLLVPQLNDLIKAQWLDGSVSYREFDEDLQQPHSCLDRDVRVPIVVIQRDGKPFFWPESEAA